MASRFANSTDTAPRRDTRGLTGLRGMQPGELRFFLDSARALRRGGLDSHRALCPGRQVALVFYEHSTRTRMSFEAAAGRIGATALVLSEATSSARKGESLRDTGRNLEAMGIEALVLRHPDPDSSAFLAGELRIPVINGGAGAGEHPTQGLYDLLTLEDALGDLKQRHIVIAGDVAHSRVARSNIFGLRSLGARVTLSGPESLVSRWWTELGVHVQPDLDLALEGADVVMLLRLQSERLEGDAPGAPGTLRARWGVTEERLERFPDLKVMHPGPITRGVELSHGAADSEHSLVMRQVENSTFVRMAVLAHALGAEVPR